MMLFAYGSIGPLQAVEPDPCGPIDVAGYGRVDNAANLH